MDNRPLLAVPIGDAAGIGPEITVKALSSKFSNSISRPVAVGDASILERALTFPNMPKVKVNYITKPSNGIYEEGILNVISLDILKAGDVALGQVNALAGKASYEYIKKAVELAMSGEVKAVVTTCINKESLRAAEVPYIGHTEILGGLTGAKNPLTVFCLKDLLVFFLSRHISLAKAIEYVTKEHLVDYIHSAYKTLEQLGQQGGKFAIAGLNPHCGEHGLFGTEEVEEIMPAVDILQKEGYPVVGPISADAVFHQGLQGKFSSVLSLYHDQGHIATKTADFARTISLTGGLPILRTSVDHGTAFDIAGKGIADEVSLEEAIRVAAKYAPVFKPAIR